MPSRKLLIGFGLLVGVATSFPALAQPAATAPYPAPCAGTSVPQAKSDEAHAFYGAGRALYDEGNYDGAITQFREAYKRDCSKHELLVILSRSYELKGDRAEAIRALEVFLERVKDSPDAGTHRTKIDNLKKQLAAQPPPPAATATVTATATPPEPREHTIPPWIVVGLGGAAVAAGVVVVATSPDLPRDCLKASKTCTPIPGESTADYDERQSQAGISQSQPVVGYVLFGGGIAIAAGGLLWHFLEPTGPASSSASIKPKVTPAVAPGYAGVSLGGTF